MSFRSLLTADKTPSRMQQTWLTRFARHTEQPHACGFSIGTANLFGTLFRRECRLRFERYCSICIGLVNPLCIQQCASWQHRMNWQRAASSVDEDACADLAFLFLDPHFPRLERTKSRDSRQHHVLYSLFFGPFFRKRADVRPFT